MSLRALPAIGAIVILVSALMPVDAIEEESAEASFWDAGGSTSLSENPPGEGNDTTTPSGETPPYHDFHTISVLPDEHPLALAAQVWDIETGTTWIENGFDVYSLDEFDQETAGQRIPLVVPVEAPMQGGIAAENIIGGVDDRVKTANTHLVPYSGVVRMFSTKGAVPSGCSGMMVDNYHVLTAGHCVTQRDVTPNLRSDMRVAPGMQDGFSFSMAYPQLPLWMSDYGTAKVTKARTFTQWSRDENYDYDVALLTLDRPIGQQVGYMTMKAFGDSDAIWKSSLTTAGYPQFNDNGMNQYRTTAKGCVASKGKFTYNLDISHGQSGSAVWGTSGGANYVLGVVSTGRFPADPEFRRPCSNTGARLTSERLGSINSWISEDTEPADRPDLVQVVAKKNSTTLDQAGFASISPSFLRSGASVSMSATVRNVGTETSAAFDVDFFLSSDATITASDYKITRTRFGGIPSMSATGASVTATLPAGIAEGSYVFGWLIDSTARVVELDESMASNAPYLIGKSVYVDNTAPAATETVSDPAIGTGPFTYSVGISASDGGSGLSLISVQHRNIPVLGTASGWSTECSYGYSGDASTSRTCIFTTADLGKHCFRAIVSDRVGNSRTTPEICKSFLI